MERGGRDDEVSMFVGETDPIVFEAASSRNRWERTEVEDRGGELVPKGAKELVLVVEGVQSSFFL